MAVLGVFGVVVMGLIPISLIALIVAAAVNKEKGNDAVKFTLGIKTVYTYIIVISTLLMIIIGSIVSVSSLLDYFLPESEVEHVEYDCDDYYNSSKCDSTLRAMRITNEKNAGLTEFLSSFALVVIAIPIFASHSKDAKKLREEKVKEKEDKPKEK